MDAMASGSGQSGAGEPAVAAVDDGNLPEGWEIRTSTSTGITYYVNKYTQQAQWQVPTERAPFPNGQLTSTDDDDEDEEEIRCSHILVKHVESRRPSSWRTERITRTKHEAYAIIENFRRRILNNASRFEQIAKVYSDCSSARHYGDLGVFRKGQMQQAFEEAAFQLQVGQLSHPVETSSGVHLILRTA